MTQQTPRPNLKLPDAYPPLELAPDTLFDKIGGVVWWLLIGIVAVFWYWVGSCVNLGAN